MAVLSSRIGGSSRSSKFLLCLMISAVLLALSIVLVTPSIGASDVPSAELIEQAAAGDEEKEGELVGEVLHKAAEDIEDTITKVETEGSEAESEEKRENEKRMLDMVKKQIDEVGHHPGITALSVPDEEATEAQKCMKKVFAGVLERAREAMESKRRQKAVEDGEVGVVESEEFPVDEGKEASASDKKVVVKSITDTLGEPSMTSMKKAAEAAETMENVMPTWWHAMNDKSKDRGESGIDMLTIVASVMQNTENGGILAFTPSEKVALNKCAEEQNAIDSAEGVRNLRGGGIPTE